MIGALGDFGDEELRAELHRVADWIASYHATLEERAIAPAVAPGDIAAKFPARAPEQGVSMEEIMREVDALIMPGIVHWSHPAFLGYFGSTSNGPALLGEMIAAALNVSAMTWRTSPAATELEGVVLAWIRELIGLPSAFMGIVYDTASVALLHALAAAREVAGSEIRERGLAGRGAEARTMRVYASDQAHSSIEKAMIVLGLGERNVIRIPSNEHFRMDVQALARAIASDETSGLKPMAVVATVGTTSTASIDPVPEIAAVCRAHGMWLHVDAAYGGALAMLPERRDVMAGAEAADSVVVNGHKWLFVPLDFSALYTRRPDVLRAVFSLTPEYLRGDAAASGAVDYMDYGIQLGRRFRALKAWMAMRAFGREGMESRIREHCRLACVFADWVGREPYYSVAAPVTMAVVCFRFEPPGWNAEQSDALNERIVEAVNAGGDAYLTHTTLRGRRAMRIGVGNVLTTERHVAHAWQRIREEGTRLSRN
ncbi:MAG: pyridoxal phosphate-dependent decarboxylase family protein [Gemmatimonas sp.]|nr:aminotransferase class I/II-fold pyridoxal phosphate-dependent enzyme [Gemmatimonadaceae bacterium]